MAIINTALKIKPKGICLFMVGSLLLFWLHILLGWLWLLMFAFRTGVIACSKFLNPGLGRPWSYRDVLFLEDYYDQRHKETLVGILTLEGDISGTRVRQLFTQHVLLQAQINNKGSSKLMKFPELTQMRTVFLGFLFWEDDPSFRIEDHISEVFYDDQSTPDCFSSMEAMMEEFTQRPYLRNNSSPWEIWVVRNFSGGTTTSSSSTTSTSTQTTTVLLLRWHHSLADAISVISHILINCLGQKTAGAAVPSPKLLKPRRPQASTPTTATTSNIFFSLVDFAVGFAKLTLDLITNHSLKQSWYAERRRKGGGGVVVDRSKVHFKFSSKLPLVRVKELAAKYGVPVPALMTTLVAHNFAKVLQSDCVTDTTTTTFYATYVLPLANHPGTLANHMALGGVHLPISNTLSFESRLKSVSDSFLRLRSDPALRVIAYLGWIVGNCPVWIVRWLKASTNLAYTPLNITNFVWDSQGFEVGGLQVGKVVGGEAPTRNVTDSIILIQGYGPTIHMTFGVNDTLLCEEDVERMSVGIGKDFDNLYFKKLKINK